MKRDDLCNRGQVFVEDNKYKLLRYEEKDKDIYMKMLYEIFDKSKEYLDSSFWEKSWNELLVDDNKLVLKIIDIEKNTYVGEVSLQNIQSNCPEIGIHIMKKYRNKGIASRILPLFLDKIKSLVEVEYFLARIRSNNWISIKLFERLGAVKIGEEGKEYSALMSQMAEKWGQDKMEMTMGKDLEEIVAYSICYSIYR
ncbi:MAG: GNAT family protein [Lachnospiraceae bacterium]|nr:GNAT family protein [Lachnospiraceae bacterium]